MKKEKCLTYHLMLGTTVDQYLNDPLVKLVGKVATISGGTFAELKIPHCLLITASEQRLYNGRRNKRVDTFVIEIPQVMTPRSSPIPDAEMVNIQPDKATYEILTKEVYPALKVAPSNYSRAWLNHYHQSLYNDTVGYFMVESMLPPALRLVRDERLVNAQGLKEVANALVQQRVCQMTLDGLKALGVSSFNVDITTGDVQLKLESKGE